MFLSVPIHLRAEPGDYASACLLPGDPLRARWIAERFLDDVRQVNGERGLLGFTGAFRGSAGFGSGHRDGNALHRRSWSRSSSSSA